MAAPPDARLVAPLGGAVEPLVHAPEAVQSARIGGIGVVDDAVLEHERAHARPIARVRGRVGSAHGRELGDGLRDRCRVHRVAAVPVVVFDEPLFTCPGHVLRHRASLLPSGVLRRSYPSVPRSVDVLRSRRFTLPFAAHRVPSVLAEHNIYAA